MGESRPVSPDIQQGRLRNSLFMDEDVGPEWPALGTQGRNDGSQRSPAQNRVLQAPHTWAPAGLYRMPLPGWPVPSAPHGAASPLLGSPARLHPQSPASSRPGPRRRCRMKPARAPRGSGHTVALVLNVLTVRGGAAAGTWPQGGSGS